MARILIIEDTEPVCQLYSFFLQRADANHDLVLTYTGEDGIRAALENQPDLVILDLNLPGISGAEVAQKLEESGILTTAPLIIVSAARRRLQPGRHRHLWRHPEPEAGRRPNQRQPLWSQDLHPVPDPLPRRRRPFRRPHQRPRVQSGRLASASPPPGNPDRPADAGSRS